LDILVQNGVDVGRKPMSYSAGGMRLPTRPWRPWRPAGLYADLIWDAESSRRLIILLLAERDATGGGEEGEEMGPRYSMATVIAVNSQSIN
jgi:hypothetical protein